MQNKNIKILISSFLAIALIFNSTMSVFRKDVKAAGEEVVAIAGIELTEEAVVAVAGILYAAGIVATTPDEVKEIFEAYLKKTYQLATMNNDDLVKYAISSSTLTVLKQSLKGVGLSASVDDDDNLVIDVPSSNQSTWIYNPSDGSMSDLSNDSILQSILDMRGNSGGDNNNGDDDNNDNDDNNLSLGKRIIAGLMAGVTGLTSIGNSFYDFLHSDDVEYIPPSRQSIKIGLSSDNFLPTAKSILAQFCTNNLHDAYIDSNNIGYDDWINWINSYFSTGHFIDSTPCQWKYCDVYILPVVKDWGNYKSYYVHIAYVYYNESYSDDYYCRIISVNTSSYWDSSFSPSVSTGGYSLAKSGDINSVSFAYTYIGTNGSSVNAYISDFTHTATYYNTNYVVDTDSDTNSDSSGAVKVGDTIYNLTQGDNIYNNQQYITQQIADTTSKDDTTLVAVPQVVTRTDSETGQITQVLDYPHSVVVNDDDTVTEGQAITFVNPDDVSYKEDTTIDDETIENENIFKLLYSFFKNFWAKLRQVLTSVFTTLFVPDLDNIKGSFDLLKAKFPIVDQVDVLLNKLINYDYDSIAPPSFLIKYQTMAFNYETPEQSMIDFSGITSFISILHGIILFICYYCFGKKVVGKLTKVFQP